MKRRFVTIRITEAFRCSCLMRAAEAWINLRIARLRGAILLALAAISWTAFAAIAGAQTLDPRATTHIIDFPHCCPRPEWWDEVEVETRIDSMETFLTVWQNQALTDQQRAKALFQAIEDFGRRDDDITVAAINYYYWVDRDYGHIRSLYEFGVGRYLDYNRSLENYSGKAGRHVGGDGEQPGQALSERGQS